MKKYPARQLFTIVKKRKTSINKKDRELFFPFNLSFKIKMDKNNNFKGPGIYIVTFKNKVIYIGSYSSHKPNIIHDRWVKHIQTFTNRGYRIGFNSESKINLIPKDFKEYFNNESYRYCDTGTVTSIERLTFASRFFDDFKLNNDKILKDFCFHYQVLSENQNAKLIESQLINKFRPICNYKSNKEIKDFEVGSIINFLHQKEFI